jgi:glycosyltransferase involved in cell wall biosynthesis
MILGIDASNIRGGGGITHLTELLKHAEPHKYGFEKVIVFSGKKTIDQISDMKWIQKINEHLLNKNLIFRIVWQKIILPKRIINLNIDVLFSLGAVPISTTIPIVSFCQNLLPFDDNELNRYRYSIKYFKFRLLRFQQSKSFKQSKAVIFLSNYSKIQVEKIIGKLLPCKIIYHGINKTFLNKPRIRKKSRIFNPNNPFKVLYVSFVGEYKHQWNLVEAVSNLRKKKNPIMLDLVGDWNDSGAVNKLKNSLKTFDPDKLTGIYTDVSYLEINRFYKSADLFVFLSTCETFGQILTEAMASGLPILCSKFSSLPEVGSDAVQYIDPLDVKSIESGIQEIFLNHELQNTMARKAFKRAKSFDWTITANETFKLLQSCAN